MELNTETLESLCELVVDCPHSTPKWTDSGIIVLRNQNIKNGVLDLNNPSFTNEEDYQKRIKRAIPRAGDIVITREAPMGEVCIIPEGLKCCLGQRQVLLRPRNESCGEYLFWALQSPYVQHQISWNEGTGTTVSNVRIPVLKGLMIPRHPKTEKKSAYTLSTLAKKLELNKQINQTLEQMAQALFKSWFVDFNPVFDNLLASVDFKLENLETSLPDELIQKAQRRLAVLNSLHNAAECKASLIALAHELQALSQTKEATKGATQSKANFNANPTILAQHANTHAHFPNEFEHNEQLGWIPKGWEKAQIQDLAKVVKGKSYKSAELSDSSTALVTLKSFKRGGGYRLDGLKAYTGKYKPEQEVFAGDLIVAYTDVTQAADVIGKPAMVISDTKYEHLVVSLDVAVVRCFDEIHKNYLYGVMKTDAFQNHSRSYTSGTTVLHLKKEAVPEYWLALPDTAVLSAFLEVSTPLYEKIDRLIDENRALTKLRDTLLPKLISGELQIPDVATDEEVVG